MSSDNNSSQGQAANSPANSAMITIQDAMAISNGENPPKRQVVNASGVLTDIIMWSHLSPLITALHPAELEKLNLESKFQVRLTCEICMEKRLRLPSWIDQLESTNTEENSEDLCVLPCGHFFGAECITTWVEQRQGDEVTPDCPMCRFPLIHRFCGHAIDPIVVPRLREDDAQGLISHVPGSFVYSLEVDEEVRLIKTLYWDPFGPTVANYFVDRFVCDECKREHHDGCGVCRALQLGVILSH
ncbi:hypothetical protein GGR58DRAFT_500172 [Xylaria digitata]|nr:hypothetical protein GGR58DRAFT_500172 [Xylaria digitata]